MLAFESLSASCSPDGQVIGGVTPFSVLRRTVGPQEFSRIPNSTKLFSDWQHWMGPFVTLCPGQSLNFCMATTHDLGFVVTKPIYTYQGSAIELALRYDLQFDDEAVIFT